MKKTKRKFAALKVVLIVFGSIIGFFLLVGLTNYFVNLSLRNYIDSFDDSSYSSDRLVPEIDEETGYYTYTTDRDLKVLQFTDIHLGGGIMSIKKDKMAIRAVIQMIQTVKPDLVVLGGDNIFAVPYVSGGTNNKMSVNTIIRMMEKAGSYYTTIFGNHDSEIFNYYNREYVSKMFLNDKLTYCIYDKNFDAPSTPDDESNQIIVVKKSDGSINKALLMIDSMAYIDHSLSSVLKWQYTQITDEQVEWAYNSLMQLKSLNNDIAFKTLCFIHIPIYEYREAFETIADKTNHTLNSTEDIIYVDGELNETDFPFIWHGGYDVNKDPKDKTSYDKLFERLTGDDFNTLEWVFCGHDHLNNLHIIYKGVHLTYGYSIDYLAYSDIDKYGLQRGTTEILIKSDGTVQRTLKNYYTDAEFLDLEKEDVIIDEHYFEIYYPMN